MAKAKIKRRGRGVAWTKTMQAELRKHSKAKTPVAQIAKAMKRTVGALRQQALRLGIGLGHQRRGRRFSVAASRTAGVSARRRRRGGLTALAPA